MKKTMILALLACVTMVFTSCNKEKELPGTSWKTHTVIDQDMTMEGITAHLNMIMDGTMKFTDATNGTMTITSSGSISAMGMTLPLDSDEETTVFTYTFDGEQGTITMTDEEDGSISVPFTYNKKENTITISQKEVDEETGMEMNIEMVFTEVK